MDIIITLPKSNYWENYEQELETVSDEKQVMNFKTPSLPKNTIIGDKCYIVHDGYIRGWMKIVGFEKNNKFKCSTTSTEWEGTFIQRSGKFNYISPIEYKGFQGWRYLPKELIK